jgi:Cu+-exporting ATPase
MFYDASKVLNVFTAILIIACPCAIALAAPFTFGNMLRIFGRHKFYVKNAQTIEKLGSITTAIFDKTGTITTNLENEIRYEGNELSAEQKSELKSVLRASNHTLSRKIYNEFQEEKVLSISNFKEFIGKGIEANVGEDFVKIGSQSYVNHKENQTNFDTSVHISFNNDYTGKFTVKNKYRNGFENVFKELSGVYETAILSGDNEGEQQFLSQKLPNKTNLYFHQKPEDKLRYIEELQDNHQHVLMVGDGLNDSGALAQSDVGIALSEDINVFSPACDAILDAEKFQLIPEFIRLAKQSKQVIRQAFIVSLVYNLVGLYFAVTGQLSPIIAAILMPLSSISIVVFTTLITNFISRKINIDAVK